MQFYRDVRVGRIINELPVGYILIDMGGVIGMTDTRGAHRRYTLGTCVAVGVSTHHPRSWNRIAAGMSPKPVLVYIIGMASVNMHPGDRLVPSGYTFALGNEKYGDPFWHMHINDDRKIMIWCGDCDLEMVPVPREFPSLPTGR